MISIDTIFTYWILVWYFFYISRIITYSPKIALILGIIHNLVTLSLLLYYKIFLQIGKYQTIFSFISIMILVKVIPLYIIRKDKYRWKDFVFLCFLFLIYSLWINENVLIIQEKIFHAILYNMRETPFMMLVNTKD